MKNKNTRISIIFIAITLLAILYLNLKTEKKIWQSNSGLHNELVQRSKAPHFEFNSPAQDFTKSVYNGDSFTLSNWKGDVIIIHFSKFHLNDLPNLLFFDYLQKRYIKKVKLLFINTLGKYEESTIKKFICLTSPIIEDDGTISSLYKAGRNETIIIGNDFRMKFKNSFASKKTVASLVEKEVYHDDDQEALEEENLINIFKGITFVDLKSAKRLSLSEIIEKKNVIIHLSISTCMTCPETKKIKILKDLAKDIDEGNNQILFLFGIGNKAKIINLFIERMQLGESSTLCGIINDNSTLKYDDYYKIFEFNIDPRIIIIKKDTKSIYIEKEGEELLNIDSFMNIVINDEMR